MEETIMMDVILSLGSPQQVQWIVLGCGLATFCSVVLLGSSPLCTWCEWTDRCGREES